MNWPVAVCWKGQSGPCLWSGVDCSTCAIRKAYHLDKGKSIPQEEFWNMVKQKEPEELSKMLLPCGWQGRAESWKAKKLGNNHPADHGHEFALWSKNLMEFIFINLRLGTKTQGMLFSSYKSSF